MKTDRKVGNLDKIYCSTNVVMCSGTCIHFVNTIISKECKNKSTKSQN